MTSDLNTVEILGLQDIAVNRVDRHARQSPTKNLLLVSPLFPALTCGLFYFVLSSCFQRGGLCESQDP